MLNGNPLLCADRYDHNRHIQAKDDLDCNRRKKVREVADV